MAHYTMPRPSAEERKRLAAYVLDERTARLPEHKRPDAGHRGSGDDFDGRSYGGRPRKAKGRKKATTGTPPSRFASYHPWRG